VTGYLGVAPPRESITVSQQSIVTQGRKAGLDRGNVGVGPSPMKGRNIKENGTVNLLD